MNRQKEFHQATILFNAWYACLIEMRHTTDDKTGVQLEDRLPKNFITISLQSISAHYDIEKIKQTFPTALEPSDDVLQTKIAEFNQSEAHKIFRGKYEMQFLVTMIELMIQDSAKNKNYIKQKLNFTFGEKLSNEQALGIFSSYAETPESLIVYLQQITK
jgi:hypothetical protein